MQVKFDSLDRFEVPDFYLCNPGSEYIDGKLTRVVGPIVNMSDEEIVMNFASLSELNFRAYKVDADGSEEREFMLKMYSALQNRRLIFVEGIGYFVITEVQESYEDGKYSKDVKATSCEVEIQNKSLTYIEDGTYEFQEILEKVVAAVPKWTIATDGIADTLKGKYRTFENVDINLNALAFLQNNMQDAYECIFVFDTINRQIHAYDQNDYAILTDIHLTKDDLVNSIEISENSSELYTALQIYGGDNLTVSGVNPLGGNVLYNFDYYLDWMSEGLRSKVKSWAQSVEDRFGEYYDLNTSYYDLLTQQMDAEFEIGRLQARIDLYTRCKENIVASNSTNCVPEYNGAIANNGGQSIDISETIDGTLLAIDELIQKDANAIIDKQIELYGESYFEELPDDAEVSGGIVAELNYINSSIQNIRSELSIQNNFSEEEYNELSDYIYEGVYTDEYIVITEGMSQSERLAQMRTLYDRAKKQLVLISSPTQEFNVDVEDFIFAKKFEHWCGQLETGCLINVEVTPGDVAALFLSSIQLNWYDHSLSLTFGNRFNRFDPKSLFEDVLGDVQKSANSVEYIKEILYPIKQGKLGEFQESINSSRTLAMNAALAASNQSVTIDGGGYTGRKVLDEGFDNKQVKIVNNSIVFTDNAWESCKTALGEFKYGETSTYGINAETIVGQMMIGGQLHILDENGVPILQAIDDKITLKIEGSTADGSSENSIISRISKLEANAEGIEMLVEAHNSETLSASSVKTSSGFTFNENGLNIYSPDSEISNQITNQGMSVSRNHGDKAELLRADYAGVEAINITVRNYLIVGSNARFEQYSNGSDDSRTACFYINSAEN